MRRNNKNGEDILKKIAPMFIDVPRDDPTYMRKYMKQKRILEKRNDPLLEQLADQAELLFRELEDVFNIHRTG